MSEATDRFDTRPLRAVVFAYACEPGRGSEPGAGWSLVQEVSHFAECTVLVAPEHTAGIARYQDEHPESASRFIEVEEPSWAPLAKRSKRVWFLAYLGWLRRARKVALRLHNERAFDVAHHATYAVYWLPSPATQMGIPSVWGPVGGGVRTPTALWRVLGWAGIVGEMVDWAAVWLASWLPGTRRTMKHATVRITQNDETARRLPESPQSRSIRLNHAMFTPPPPAVPALRADYLLWVSGLEARKGPSLAIKALAETPDDVRLVMVGDGPRRSEVERLAERLGVADRLEMRGRLARDAVFELMGSAAGFVSTGLREEGGIALAEAMMTGIPVVVLAHGGAKTLAERGVDPDRIALIEPGRVSDTARRMGEAMTRLVRHPVAAGGPLLDQEAARRELAAAFAAAAGRDVSR